MSRQSLVTQALVNMTDNNKMPMNNLYQHLSQMLTKVPVNQNKINNFKQFERLSELIKKTTFRNHQPLFETEIQINSKRKIQYSEWIQRQEKVIYDSQTVKNTENLFIENFVRTQNILKQVGISFGQEQAFKINCMLKRVAQKFKATKLRYWGKILTGMGDYTVLQGVASKINPPAVEGSTQKYRQGVNYYSFWVSHQSIGEQFIELPIITPDQMVASRKMKYIFTGNPNAQILGYPKFPGLQKHFLKAQLVRITHNCQIAPKGLYTNLQENPDEIQYAEQFKFPDFAQLSNLQNWVHINPYILNMGRANYYTDPKLPEEQKQELMTKLTQSDPKIERLKGINQDRPVQRMGHEGCWIARVYGNTQLFNNVGKEQGTTSCYGFVSLKNPNWPGWMTACSNKAFGSIYIGYGIKATQASFSPQAPEDLLPEGEDNDQFHEPNPRDPPDELQPDSDDQNKKPQE